MRKWVRFQGGKKWHLLLPDHVRYRHLNGQWLGRTSCCSRTYREARGDDFLDEGDDPPSISERCIHARYRARYR